MDPKPSECTVPGNDATSLTCIPGRIHSVAASQGADSVEHVDDLEVEHFLDTLVDVAFAIAARNANKPPELKEQQDKRMK